MTARRELAIHIEDLEVWSRIGVPDAERAHPQRLLVCATLHDAPGPSDDAIHGAVDYLQVSRALAEVATGGERRLVETLAAELAEMLLARFCVAEVEVAVKKFILPATRWVEVRCRASRA